MIQLLRRFDALVAKFESWALTGLILAMALIAVVQVFLRNLYPSHALTWADTTVRMMVFWVGFMGASLAASMGKHLAIDVMSHVLPDWFKVPLARLTDFLAAFVAGILAWQAYRFLEMEGNNTYIILPLGFGMVSLRFLLRAVAGAQESPLSPTLPPQGGEGVSQ